MRQTVKEEKYSSVLSSKLNLAVGYDNVDYNIAQQ